MYSYRGCGVTTVGTAVGRVAGFEGEIVRPGDTDYDVRRRVWNAMHDRRPALIARCTSRRDVRVAIDHGTMLMVHEFGQRMVQRGGGAIVNVGSTVIVRGSPRAPQYAAGKYGLLGVTKSYAKALAPTVRVNTFAPGFMETEALLNRPEWQAGRREIVLSGTPAGKIPKPEEMTGAALFLASEDAHHITGSYMIADGGYSMLGA